MLPATLFAAVTDRPAPKITEVKTARPSRNQYSADQLTMGRIELVSEIFIENSTFYFLIQVETIRLIALTALLFGIAALTTSDHLLVRGGSRYPIIFIAAILSWFGRARLSLPILER